MNSTCRCGGLGARVGASRGGRLGGWGLAVANTGADGPAEDVIGVSRLDAVGVAGVERTTNEAGGGMMGTSTLVAGTACDVAEPGDGDTADVALNPGFRGALDGNDTGGALCATGAADTLAGGSGSADAVRTGAGKPAMVAGVSYEGGGIMLAATPAQEDAR